MFGKNKKKPEYRVRFQDPGFRRQLKQARGYKRNTRSFPHTKLAVFLSKLGLGSWWSRIITLLIFLLLVYAVYIPNPFFIKHLNISGTDFGYDQNIQPLVNVYLNRKTPWPQKNLLLMSPSGLKSYLLKEDSKILSVDVISKKFPNTLTIKVTPRVDEFALQNGDGEFYSVSNDGLITSQLPIDASGTLPSNLVLIKLTGSPNIAVGEKLLPQEQIDFLSGLVQKLSDTVDEPLSYLQTTDFSAPDISVFSKSGLEIKFDLTSDLNSTLDRLSVLVSQVGNLKNLQYIDMRFGDRAYVCAKTAPCAAPTVMPEPTSTPASSGNPAGEGN